MLRLIIIEDEFFAANHLNNLVTSLDYKVQGIYHSGEDFLQETDWEFDAALLDIILEKDLSGLDVAAVLKKKGIPFIFLTANEDDSTLQRASKLSPSAYLTKPFKNIDVSASLSILANRIEDLRELSYHSLLRENDLTTEPLTSREIDVLKGLVEEQTTSEICASLFISKNTVKYHIKNLYRKLDVNTRDEICTKIASNIIDS
ncbi:MAG: response regulator [Crocinitomix sp.]|nr:response regulator [Crocinitomix sp.]